MSIFRYTEDDGPPKQDSHPEVKTEIVTSAEVKEDVKVEEDGQNDAGEQQMYGNEQDGDEEIDFNLGNGYDAPTNHHEGHGPGIKEDG